MVSSFVTGSAVVMTLDAGGSPFEFEVFSSIATPRSGAQDTNPPAGAITTADVLTSISLIGNNGYQRRITLTSGSLTKTLHVSPTLTYLYKQGASPGWVRSDLLTAGLTVAGYNGAGSIGTWTISSIATPYMSSYKGILCSFRGDTTLKALFLNDIYVKFA